MHFRARERRVTRTVRMSDVEVVQTEATASRLGYKDWSTYLRDAALQHGARMAERGFSGYVEWRLGQNAIVQDALRDEIATHEAEAATVADRLHDPLEHAPAALRARAEFLTLKVRSLRDQADAIQRDSDRWRETVADFRQYLTRKETPA